MANPENETSKLLKNSEKPRTTQMSTPPPFIGCCTPIQPLLCIGVADDIGDDCRDALRIVRKKQDQEKAALQVNQGEEPVAVQKDSLLAPIPAASTSTQTSNSRYQFYPPVPTNADVVTPTSTPQPTLNPLQP